MRYGSRGSVGSNLNDGLNFPFANDLSFQDARLHENGNFEQTTYGKIYAFLTSKVQSKLEVTSERVYY